MDTIDDIIALYCKYTTDNYNILYSDNNLYIFMHHRWISYESSSLINDFIRWYNTEYLSNYFGTGKIHIVIALLNAINKGDYNITIIDNFTKFYKDNYNSQLNKNSYLIGFSNGVYDLKNNEFRNGKLEDYLSLSVGYDYLEYKSEIYQSMMESFLIKTIFKDEEVWEYLLNIFANILTKSYNININFIGNDDNIRLLISDIFGNYSINIKDSDIIDANTIKAKKICLIEKTDKQKSFNNKDLYDTCMIYSKGYIFTKDIDLLYIGLDNTYKLPNSGYTRCLRIIMAKIINMYINKENVTLPKNTSSFTQQCKILFTK